ncbi:hypothetical protein C8Q70DRAFT_220408 [Cubamyces menziesii]|nr:hypothetical protein C8Q70DRAFT_220408 [Cubamyces menziesii]
MLHSDRASSANSHAQQDIPIPPILKMNNDILTILAEAVMDAGDALPQLSMTCKRLRVCTMPILFRACIANHRVAMMEEFLPKSLWPYVQSLLFRDRCLGWNARHCLRRGPETSSTPSSTVDSLLCDAYEPDMLRHALVAMPRLRSIKALCHAGTGHGLPWDVLQAILTVPHLHQFTCHHYLFSPREIPTDRLVLAGPTRLTTFRYMLNTYRPSPRGHAPERDALSVVLRTHHETLEVLWLPTETAPFQTLRSLKWPSLLELRLRGELVQSDNSLLSALGNMPNLRLLKLDVALPRDTSPQPVWPPGEIGTYSWPMLEDVQISFPCMDDQLYGHLPPTLRRLSLRFFPHRIVHHWCTT